VPAAPPVIVLSADRCGNETFMKPRTATVMLLDIHDLPGARYDVELLDLSGQKLQIAPSLTVSASTVAFPCRGLSAGVYILRLFQNSEVIREFKITVRPGVEPGC
jgi:hypothetical protein